MKKRLRGNILLLITALIWGSAFVAQSEGMNYVGPFTYNAVRTLLGAVVLLPVIAVFGRKKNTGQKDGISGYDRRATVTGGIVCGIFLFIASSFQQSGIALTTAGKAGFVTALYIIIVPLIELIICRKSRLAVWLCAVLACVGFYLLCIGENFTIGKGDLLVLCCAFFFALHIMVIDRFNAKNADGVRMSCIQFFTAGILMTICTFIFENPRIGDIIGAGYTILYAGILSSGVAYTLQILGQRDTDPTSATLIMSLESVFAALSGWLILGESLTARELIGCILVFSAVILAQLKPNPTEICKTEKKS